MRSAPLAAALLATAMLGGCWLTLDFSELHDDADLSAGADDLSLGVDAGSDGASGPVDLLVCTPDGSTFHAWHRELADLPIARGEGAAILWPDWRAFVVGGYASTTNDSAIIELVRQYDSSTQPIAWTLVGNLTVGRSSFSLLALPDGGATIVGGGTNAGNDATEMRLDETAVQTLVGPGPFGVTGLRYAASTVGPDGTRYVFGGEGASPLTTTWESATLGAWQPSLALPSGRQSAASATFDGRLYLAGGIELDDAGVKAPMTRCDRRLPAAGSWEACAPLPRAVVGPTLLQPADGRLYVVSGSADADGNGGWAFVYDPCGQRWVTLPARVGTPVMVPIRNAAVALVGPDARLYSVGGNGSQEVFVYGPALRRLVSGSDLKIDGGPYPAGATVSVHSGTPDGALLATVTTTAAGALPDATASGALTVSMSAIPSGTSLWVIDDMTQFPVRLPAP